MKKRIILLSLLIAFVLVGCGNQEDVESVVTESVVEEEGTVIFEYNGKEYNVTDRNDNINVITGTTDVGKHIIVEGHIGPYNGVYSIFNTETEDFDKDIVGTNLVWHSDDITTGVYSFWEKIYNYDGELIATCELAENAYVDEIRFIEDNTKIEVEICPVSSEKYTVVFSV